MSFCKKCGAELKKGEKYCVNCGTSVSEPQRRGRRREEIELIPEEKIPEIKTIVYKTVVDPSTVKLIGEREKGKLFSKMGFLKPKSEDVQFHLLEKFYDPYFIINGRYFIDYYRKRVFRLPVEKDVSEIVVFNQTLKPKTATFAKLREKRREVELETEERIIKENYASTVIDRKGLEVKVEEFPTAPAEEHPEKLAKAGYRAWRIGVSPEQAIVTFRSRVVSRPKDAERIAKELFEVLDYTLVYMPVYRATYKNVKTQEQKTILVNGITSKLEKTD